MPPIHDIYIDGVRVTSIVVVGGSTGCSVTSSGLSAPAGSEQVWTYSGSGTFLGFSLTSGATTPDSGYAVGDTFYVYSGSTTFYLYSVEATASNDPYLTTGFDLASIADAIRNKTWGTSDLTFPSQYISSISNLPTGNIQSSRSVTYNSPGSATITPSSGYVGFESAYIEFAPNVWDGQYTWTPPPPSKGDVINIDMNGDSVSEQYLVLKITGTIAEVFGRVNLTQTKYANSGDTYEGSLLDTYLNTTWYNSLSSTAKSAIVDKIIYQESWACDNSGSPVYIGSIPSGVPDYWQISLVDDSYGNSITRHVYAPSVQDVIDFYGATSSMTKDNTTMTKTSMAIMFPDMSNSGDNVWLRSKESRFSNYAVGCQGYIYRLVYVNTTNSATYRYVRPAFQIDLSKIEWSFAS